MKKLISNPDSKKSDTHSPVHVSPGIPVDDRVVERCAYALAEKFAAGETSPHLNEIAKAVGCSRNSVKGYLETAVKRGLLRLSVELPENTNIGQRLAKKFGLVEAVVTATPIVWSDQESVRSALATETVRYMVSLCTRLAARNRGHSPIRIGLDGGQTIFRVAREIGGCKLPVCEYEFVPLVFGPLKGPQFTASIVANIFATRVESSGSAIHVRDGFQIEADWKHARRASGQVHFTVNMPKPDIISDLDIVLLGIGSNSAGQLFEEIRDRKDERTSIEDHFGDILNIAFDRCGDEVQSISRSRAVPFGLSHLAAHSQARSGLVLGIAGGADKLDAIRVVLNRHYVSVLITDTTTALKLVE